jgi:hypothetical protein
MATTTPHVVSVVLQKWMYAVPDEHWVAKAFPYACQTKAVAIEVERGSITRRYEMAEITALLNRYPMYRQLGGIGHPEPQKNLRVLQTGGRHAFAGDHSPASRIIPAR